MVLVEDGGASTWLPASIISKDVLSAASALLIHRSLKVIMLKARHHLIMPDLLGWVVISSLVRGSGTL